MDFDKIKECQRAEALARTLAADPERSAPEIADAIMKGGFDIQALAYGFAFTAAQTAHRGAVHTRERDVVKTATKPTKPAAPDPTPTVRTQTREEWEREYYSRPEVIAAQEEADRRYEEGQARIRDMMEDMAIRRAEEIVADWTADLLASTFALPDGTKVTWGDATQQQHRERIAMLVRQAAGTVETAALHEKALREIAQAGVKRLGDLC